MINVLMLILIFIDERKKMMVKLYYTNIVDGEVVDGEVVLWRRRR